MSQQLFFYLAVFLTLLLSLCPCLQNELIEGAIGEQQQ